MYIIIILHVLLHVLNLSNLFTVDYCSNKMHIAAGYIMTYIINDNNL